MGVAMEALKKTDAIQILRLPDVCRITGISRSTIYQMEAEARFPRRVRIGLRAVGWVQSEVQDWIAVQLKTRPGSSDFNPWRN